MKKISLLLTIISLFIRLSYAESAPDPERCVLNAVINSGQNRNIEVWQIREACMNIFLDTAEKDATLIPGKLISQAILETQKYPSSGNIFGTINLKNNSNLKVIFANIAITDIETLKVECYRFRPIRNLISTFSIGDLKGTIIAPKSTALDGSDFSKNYTWHFVSIYGYH